MKGRRDLPGESLWSRAPPADAVTLTVFHVALDPGEDGWVVAECPALPGCVPRGRDEKGAPDNIKEAGIARWATD